MKLISWNIQWGLGADGRLDLGRIVREARRMADFDVLCLQEVADNLPELESSLGENQFVELARLLPEYTAVGGAATDVLGRDGRRARFGNLLFSRYPVLRAVRHNFPWMPERGSAVKSMARNAVEAVIALPCGPLRVMTTHLEAYSKAQRSVQIERLREAHHFACGRARKPFVDGTGPFAQTLETMATVLCGDFNMKPQDPLLAGLLEPFPRVSGIATPRFFDAWRVAHPKAAHPGSAYVHPRTDAKPTGKAKRPYCCDYTFVSANLRARVSGIEYESQTQASDHQPMILTLADAK